MAGASPATDLRLLDNRSSREVTGQCLVYGDQCGGTLGLRVNRLLLEAEARFRLDPFTVRSLALFQSILTHDGPIYEELARYPLQS